MVFSLDQIFLWLSIYKYWLIFPIAVIEGPIVTVIAGFLSSLGTLNLFISYTIVVIGDVIGDSIYYAIGRWGREGFINKWGRLFRIDKDKSEKLEKYFEDHAGKSLIIGKWTHATEIGILVAAGLAKVKFWKATFYNFIGSLPKSLVLILIGYYFGEAYHLIDKYLDIATLVMFIIIVSATLIYYLVRRIRKKTFNE